MLLKNNYLKCEDTAKQQLLKLQIKLYNFLYIKFSLHIKYMYISIIVK